MNVINKIIKTFLLILFFSLVVSCARTPTALDQEIITASIQEDLKALKVDAPLTNIDLYAYKKGLPYSYTVPNFPIITTNHEISYGKDLNLP